MIDTQPSKKPPGGTARRYGPWVGSLLAHGGLLSVLALVGSSPAKPRILNPIAIEIVPAKRVPMTTRLSPSPMAATRDGHGGGQRAIGKPVRVDRSDARTTPPNPAKPAVRVTATRSRPAAPAKPAAGATEIQPVAAVTPEIQTLEIGAPAVVTMPSPIGLSSGIPTPPNSGTGGGGSRQGSGSGGTGDGRGASKSHPTRTDTRQSKARPPRLVYPKKDRPERRGEVFVVLLMIDKDGYVDGVRLQQGVNPHKDQKALDAIWRFRYRPALDASGRPIAFKLVQRFMLE